MTTLPVVGVSAYEADASWGSWRRRATLLPTSYVRGLERAGAAPVVLPVGSDATSVVARLDALVLAGGPDVDPALYDAKRQAHTEEPDPARDASELALLSGALARGIPVLAVCRGLQLLNVVRGGTLHQHLPDVVGTDAHRPRPGTFGERVVRIKPGSGLASAVGSTVTVSCHHHQAVDRVGSGLEAVAWDDDGTVEALESRAAPELLAVQWHPEEEDSPPLFAWLVARARHGA